MIEGARVPAWRRIVWTVFDAETFLLLKSVSAVDAPELGGRLEQTTEMRDYRDVGGVKAPFSVTAVNTAQTVAITLTKIDLNVPIDDAVFARPVRWPGLLPQAEGGFVDHRHRPGRQRPRPRPVVLS